MCVCVCMGVLFACMCTRLRSLYVSITMDCPLIRVKLFPFTIQFHLFYCLCKLMSVPYTLSVHTVAYLFVYICHSMQFMLIGLDQCKMSNNSIINLLTIVMSRVINCIQKYSGVSTLCLCDEQITFYPEIFSLLKVLCFYWNHSSVVLDIESPKSPCCACFNCGTFSCTLQCSWFV